MHLQLGHPLGAEQGGCWRQSARASAEGQCTLSCMQCAGWWVVKAEAQTGRLCCAGKLHGYGFVQFETQAGAEQACQLHGSDFMGRQLTVDVATAAEGGKAPTGTPVEGCWFCLSNPDADVNLVASIGALRCVS